MTKKEKGYVETILANDENSTDEELIELFMRELKITKVKADKIVSKRWGIFNTFA